MLKFLRDRRLRSSWVLIKTRKPTDPTLNDFRRQFGSWREAVRLAFGSDLAVDKNSEYMIKAIYEMNLWSVARFRAARKSDPVVIPSWRQVVNGWGSYRNMFEWARRKHLRKLLEEYRVLIRKLGHVPSHDEIRAANLRMDEAIEFYGTKKEMDDFVLTMKG